MNVTSFLAHGMYSDIPNHSDIRFTFAIACVFNGLNNQLTA